MKIIIERDVKEQSTVAPSDFTKHYAHKHEDEDEDEDEDENDNDRVGKKCIEKLFL